MSQQIFRKIVWFDNRTKYDIDFFEYLQPQRTVSEHHRYKSGLFYSEKCKRHIQYESALELDFIKQLEQMKKVKFYYEQPVKVVYWRGKRKRTYTPDFGLYLDTKEFVLVEIKDLPSMLDSKVQMKTEALLDFCNQKGFGLLLTDGRNTIDKIKKIKTNRVLEKEILKAIQGGVLLKNGYEEIRKKCNSTQNELLKVVLKNNLKYRPFPFKLQAGNNNNKIFRHVIIEKKRYERVDEELYPTLFRSRSNN